MTISFSNATLFNGFPIKTAKFELTPRQSRSRLASGKPIAVDYGLATWTASYTTPPISHDMCIEIEALLNSQDGAVNEIRVWDTRREYPLAYPTGAFSDSGSITTWGGSGKSVTITGLPANFVINRGDYFAYTYGGKRYLHQAVEAVTASGAGATTDFEIRPHYPTGATGTVAVAFQTPHMNVVLDGPPQFDDTGGLTGTITFSVVQSLA